MMRIQKRVRGGRKPLPATVLREIREKIEQLARRHKVSKSFVIATILAEALHVKSQEKYYE
jgi:predicted nucleic acid-binding protein